MPKVTFINEARTVEVDAGRTISDVAAELGIDVCREEFVGTGFGNYSVWVKGPDGCVSPPGFWEKLLGGAGGWRRQANRARILGDMEIYTQAGLGDRLRAPRPVAAPPTPKTDPAASAPRRLERRHRGLPLRAPPGGRQGHARDAPRNTGKPAEGRREGRPRGRRRRGRGERRVARRVLCRPRVDAVDRRGRGVIGCASARSRSRGAA